MSAELALQGAIFSALSSTHTVYDRVPDEKDVVFPYVHFRSFQTVDDGADCVDGVEVFADIDVWSVAVGKPEASTVAGQVRAALHEANLDLGPDYRLISLLHRSTNIDADRDTLTRARMTFVALIDRV